MWETVRLFLENSGFRNGIFLFYYRNLNSRSKVELGITFQGHMLHCDSGEKFIEKS
jgi:hypothetical protein